MKVKEGFVIRQVAGKYVVAPVGERAEEFHGVVKLNETAKIIWEGLADGLGREEIVERLAADSGAEREVIAQDVDDMIREMADAGFLTQ